MQPFVLIIIGMLTNGTIVFVRLIHCVLPLSDGFFEQLEFKSESRFAAPVVSV